MTTNDMVIRFRVDGAGKVTQEITGVTQELGKTAGAASNVASAAKSMVSQFTGAGIQKAQKDIESLNKSLRYVGKGTQPNIPSWNDPKIIDTARKYNKELNKELKEQETRTNSLSNSVKKLATRYLSVYAAARTIKTTIEKTIEQERVNALLAASLKQTGVYTDKLQNSLERYASALQNATIYSDEAITSATTLMQNIGNLSADQIPKAQKAAIGLAAAYNKDLDSAFAAIGKAATGNTLILKKWGIVIDESLSPAEKLAKIIEIGTSKFGLAEAAAKTTAGQFMQFKNIIGDMAETIGATLVPVVLAVITVLRPVAKLIRDLNPVVLGLDAAIIALVISIVKLNAAAKATGIVLGLTTAFKSLAVGIGVAATAVKGFFVSIGPVGWALLGSGAAMTVFSLASKKSAENMDNMGDAIASVRSESIQSITQFDALAEKYLKLRQNTQLTKNETTQLKNVINSLRTQYGAYLSDLDLERGKYGDVAAAIRNTRTALEGLAQRRVQEAIVGQYAQEIAQAEREKARLEQKYTEAFEKLRNWPEGQDYKVFTEATQRAMDQAQAGIRTQIDIIDNLTNEMKAALQRGITLPPVTITDDSNSNNGSIGKTKDDPLAEEKRRAAELIKTFSDRRKEIEKIYAQDKLILADYVKDAKERTVYLTNLEKKYNADVAALNEEELRINFDKIQKMFKYNELMGVKNQEYYDNLKQLKADEIALYQFDSEKTAALIKKANDEIDKERMEFVRGDALLAELRQFGMSQAETYQAQYDEQKARLQKAVGDQKAIIAEYQKSGLFTEGQAATMVENLTSGLSTAFAAMSAELAKNLESLKEKTDEVAEKDSPFQKWLEGMTPIYDTIETLTSNIVNAFGQMITEGKSFGDVMKEAFKSWVGSAISEIARLMARMVALFLMRAAFNALTGGTESLGFADILKTTLGIKTGGGKPGLGDMPLNVQPSLVNPLPPVSGDASLNRLIGEVQGLRQDVYNAQPTTLKMDWRKGEMSQAVDRDRRYRLVMN